MKEFKVYMDNNGQFWLEVKDGERSAKTMITNEEASTIAEIVASFIVGKYIMVL